MNSKIRYQLIKLSKNHIPDLINLSASVGWDYDEHEINTILSVGTVFGHINEKGDIISSAAIIPYDSVLASIGMVIVNKNYRGYGLGKEVTEACIKSVSSETTIMLIATDEGKALYKKLGFQTFTYVHKFLCGNYTPFRIKHGINDYKIVPLKECHFNQVKELDHSAIGADRTSFLKVRIEQAKEGIVVKNSKGDIVGYGLCVEGSVNLILGPIVAMNDDVATHIIEHLVQGYQGKLRIDVPDGQESFMKYLEKSGFMKDRKPPVMIKNSMTLPLRNKILYGIAAQVFG